MAQIKKRYITITLGYNCSKVPNTKKPKENKKAARIALSQPWTYNEHISVPQPKAW